MINEDIWVHIVEMKNKAYYLLTKLDDDYVKDLAEAIDAIYFKYKNDFQ